MPAQTRKSKTGSGGAQEEKEGDLQASAAAPSPAPASEADKKARAKAERARAEHLRQVQLVGKKWDEKRRTRGSIRAAEEAAAAEAAGGDAPPPSGAASDATADGKTSSGTDTAALPVKGLLHRHALLALKRAPRASRSQADGALLLGTAKTRFPR